LGPGRRDREHDGHRHRNGRHHLERLRVAEPRDENACRHRAQCVTDIANGAEHTMGRTVPGATRDVCDERARRAVVIATPAA
jgi:hypothetical protein